MKCPHCNYQHEYDIDLGEIVKGKEGDFFQLSNDVSAEREGDDFWGPPDSRIVYACPSCLKLFISEY